MVDNKYPAWVNNGLLECMKFQDCFHDNIQRMLGISVDQNRFYEFYPAYSRGFKEYLNDAKHVSINYLNGTELLNLLMRYF